MAKRSRAREEFISGLCMTCAFTVIWFFHGSNFWVFPLVFAGLVPAIRGAVRLMQARTGRIAAGRESAAALGVNSEKEILLIARDEGGRVTPSIIAVRSSLSIEESERALEDLVKRGYASLEVNPNGRLEYVFSEFLPKPEG